MQGIENEKKYSRSFEKTVSVVRCYCATFCDTLKCQNKSTSKLFSTLMDSPVKDVSVAFMNAEKRQNCTCY